jgi:hemolysin activation/secretion protein
MYKISIRMTAAAVVVLSAGSAAAAIQAQPRPDAGQVTREVQPSIAPVPPVAAQGAATAAAPARQEDGARVQVKAFRIQGAEVLPAAELQALVADLVGRSLSLAELDAGVQRITARYRQRGYSVARAYLPQQEIQDGVVVISVLEGRVAARKLRNASQLSDARVDAYLDDVQAGEVIRSEQIDRGLLLLNDTPGVAGARATLQPGASVGTADLVVDVAAGRPYAAYAGIDNHGNRYTGEARASGGLALNSPLHIGDQFNLDLLTSGRGLTFGRIAYRAPIGADGLRAGVAAYATHYRLGREFRSLDADGTANSVSAFAFYPFIRSANANLTGAITVEQKALKDVVGATATTTEKRARPVTLGLTGTRQDRFAGGGVSSLDLSIVAGDLDIRSPSARAIDALSARTEGRYARITLELGRYQRLTARDILVVTGSAQRASRNLDSSEKFAIGGLDGVRAYPTGEGIGDEGGLASVEWRHDLSSSLQAAAFYDAGYVRISHDPFVAGDNSRTLSGAGLGLYARIARVQLKAAAAWRLQGGRPISTPQDRQPTLWLQASTNF